MFSQVSTYLQRRENLLAEGRLEDMVADYVWPQIIYRDSELLALPNPASAIAFLQLIQRERAKAGIRRSRFHIDALELPRDGRFRAWITFQSVQQDGSVQGCARAVFYFVMVQQRLCTEMMAFFSDPGEASAQVSDLRENSG